MADVRAALARAREQLDEHGDADALLLHVVQKPRSWLFAHADDILADDITAIFQVLVERRAAGEPLAYITGRRGFWTLDLRVTPATLIPRAETERLVELALQRIPADSAFALADLGTGSGAIALAIASERPRAKVSAIDASAAALAVARNNAQRLGLANVEFLHGDWLAPLAGRRYGLIVVNPPYIAADDPHLKQGDLRHEPITALVAGHDGLEDIRRIVVDAHAVLEPGGWLLLEHGWDQGVATRALLRDAGYAEIFTAVDLEQRDRVSGARRVRG